MQCASIVMILSLEPYSRKATRSKTPSTTAWILRWKTANRGRVPLRRPLIGPSRVGNKGFAWRWGSWDESRRRANPLSRYFQKGWNRNTRALRSLRKITSYLGFFLLVFEISGLLHRLVGWCFPNSRGYWKGTIGSQMNVGRGSMLNYILLRTWNFSRAGNERSEITFV